MEDFRMHRYALPLLAAVLLATTVAPSDTAAQVTPDSARIAELERRLEAISRELERVDLGEDVVRALSLIHI